LSTCNRIDDQSVWIFVSADEGHFDKNGEFIADRRRNGDEIFRRGLWVEEDTGVCGDNLRLMFKLTKNDADAILHLNFYSRNVILQLWKGYIKEKYQ